MLKRGLEEDWDHFDLLLHCILIITSVIPPGLKSVAVDSALVHTFDVVFKSLLLSFKFQERLTLNLIPIQTLN